MTNPFDPKAEPQQVDPVPDPRASYHVPADVLDDAHLSVDEKKSILTTWAAEVDDRLKAEEEGMSASDPMRARHEAELAKEAERVNRALLSLEDAA